MKRLTLLTLFALVLHAANASKDESRNQGDFGSNGYNRNRPTYPFEAFNLGYNQFLQRIHPPLLAAMNKNEPSDESYERTETEKHHHSMSDSKTEVKESKSESFANIEHSESKTSTEAVIEIPTDIHPSSSISQSSELSESKSSSSESVDYIPRFILDALGLLNPDWDSESDSSSHDSPSAVYPSELSDSDRDSSVKHPSRSPFFVSRSRHDSLEFNQDGDHPDSDSTKSTDSRTGSAIDDIFEAFEESGNGEHPRSQSESEVKATSESYQVFIYPDVPVENRNEGSRSESLVCTGSKECESAAVDSGTSESVSRERIEQSDDASSKSTVSIALELDGASGFDDMALQETCYDGALVDSSNAKGMDVEIYPEDVRKSEEVTQKLSIKEVRERLEGDINHLNDIKKKAMKKNNVLGDLNRVIADLEFLCEKICLEIPDKYLSSESESF